MKSYTITVNGNVYDVTVEENTNGAPAAAPAPKSSSTGTGSGSKTGSSRRRSRKHFKSQQVQQEKYVDVVGSSRAAAVKKGDH